MNLFILPFFPMGVIFFATFMQAITGFGLAIIATPFLLIIYTPQDIVVILQIINLVVNSFFGFFLRKNLDQRLFLWLCVGAMLGQVVALFIYQGIPTQIIKVLISIVILLFLAFSCFQGIHIQETKFHTLIAGFFSGTLNILVAMGGPPLLIYLANTGRPHTSIRANCIIYFAFTNVTAIAGLMLARQDFSHALDKMPFLLPVALFGLFIGNLMIPHVSTYIFKRLLYMMLLFTALYTLYATFVA